MNHDDPPQDELDPYDTEPGPDPAQDAEPVPPLSSPTSTSPNYAAPVSPEPTSLFCIQCGYNLTGIAIGSTCPECGRAVAPSFYGQTLPTSGKSVASLVLGICSIPACVFYGVPAIICGILAIFFAKQAKAQFKAGKAGASTQPMATAGLVCGIIGLCLGLLYLLGIVAFIIFAINANP